MDPSYFACTEAIYRDVDKCIPGGEGNACAPCSLCCSGLVSLGVSLLELDYMEEYLLRNGRNPGDIEKFREYVNIRNNDSIPGRERLCTFYDVLSQACSIYAARPLACRTFGYLIKEESLSRIPSSCALKDKVVTYTDESFPHLFPFAVPFYYLVYSYDRLFQSGNK